MHGIVLFLLPGARAHVGERRPRLMRLVRGVLQEFALILFLGHDERQGIGGISSFSAFIVFFGSRLGCAPV